MPKFELTCTEAVGANKFKTYKIIDCLKNINSLSVLILFTLQSMLTVFLI